jgi:hypothetical protein
MRSAAVAVIAVGLAGCAQGLTKSPKPDGPPTSELAGQTFGVPGEAMEFQVALRGVTVGRVVVSVGKPGFVDGRRAIIVRSRGTSAGFLSLISDLRWELTTTLDLDTGLPIHEIEESWLQIKGEPEHHRDERTWGERGYNLHAAAGALRGWQSRAGQRATFDVTIDHNQLDVELWESARELLASAQEPAVRYDGIVRGKYHFAVWISDDEARVPLLLRTDTKWGAVAVELVRYDPPIDR